MFCIAVDDYIKFDFIYDSYHVIALDYIPSYFYVKDFFSSYEYSYSCVQLIL